MGLLVLGLLVYFGILFCVWLVSSAFDNFGAFGIVMIIAAIIIGLWIGHKTHDDKKDKEK